MMFPCQRGKSAISSDEYRRLEAAFITMAEQSDLPNAQARWHALAETCSSLATDLPARSRTGKREGERQAPVIGLSLF
jgi:hypothetical protein